MHAIKGINCTNPKIETEKSSNMPQMICKSENIDISAQINSNDGNSSPCTEFESRLELIKDKMTKQLNNPSDIEELLDEQFFSPEYIITPSFCESNQSLLLRLQYSHSDPPTNKNAYYKEFHFYYKNQNGAALYDKINDILTVAKSETRIFSAEIIRQTTYFFQEKYYKILYFIIFQLFQTIDPTIVSSDLFIAKYEDCAEIIYEYVTDNQERIDDLNDCQNLSDESIDFIVHFSIWMLVLFFASEVFHLDIDYDYVDFHENSIKYFKKYKDKYQYDEFEIILTKPLVYKKINFDSLLFILNEFKLTYDEAFSNSYIFNNYQKYSVDIDISNLFELLWILLDNKQAFPLRSKLYSMIKNHFMLNKFPKCSDNLIKPSNENEIKQIVVEIRQILRENDPTKQLESKIEKFCNLIDTNSCK